MGGFDPARERAIVSLAREALERTRDSDDAVESAELVATGVSYADQPLEAIGARSYLTSRAKPSGSARATSRATQSLNGWLDVGATRGPPARSCCCP